MSQPTAPIARAVREFAFRPLFIELGWDNYQAELPVVVDGETYRLRGVAQKRGLAVFHLQTAEFPPGPLRNKIETQVARSHREHILIFSDDARARQAWLWALREIGRPLARRSFDYHAGHSGEALAQRLGALAFSLDEEEDLTLVEVAGRVRAAFNVERATKRFYDQFRKERDAFEKFIGGIPDLEMTKWYVSVMLNRLMFVYFIQKKGFLDGDADYLRHRLAAVQAAYGEDQFDRFYRAFLLRLFHEGLGRPGRDAELERLIGRVPYLNGGIFQLHEVETRYPDIHIPDEAFGKVFDFFDQYQWHLDDRPLRDDNQINPDVLGYIFEKYINQKQMGAYYTKEDITEYISKNTIIPFLFDRARADCAVAFRGEGSVWALAAADPDRYIHEAARHGAERPLPDDIAAGLDDVAARGLWNTPTPDEWGLPTEIWRETVARRRRYEATRAALADGRINDINDFISHNLDIRQFAQDVVEQAEGADLLLAFWDALCGVSVLDPTCGSGAFLFAALNVLEPLYEAAIGRMRDFTGSEGWRGQHPRYAQVFDGVLADIERHPNEAYYIQKTIIVNNLYGVDIMAEAVEIARLRLFLKLASQLESADQVEPLPDIDFNIRAGNTLVGYVKREEIRRALAEKRVSDEMHQQQMIFGEQQDELKVIEEKAADIDRLYNQFRAMMTGTGPTGEGQPAGDLAATKAELQRRLAALNDELDRALARQYGEGLDKGKAFDQWRDSHQPFHWFTEFYGILQGGGFDVVIGNPPYVEYSRIRKQYMIRNYTTESCGNLYAFVLERCLNLYKSSCGSMGLIIPMPAINTGRMNTLQTLLRSINRDLWISNYDERPSNLFSGVDQRLSIVIIGKRQQTKGQLHTTGINRWNSSDRDTLFQSLSFASLAQEDIEDPRILKASHSIENSIFRKWLKHSPISRLRTIRPINPYKLLAYRTAGGRYWKVFLDKPFPTDSLSNKVAYFAPHVDPLVMVGVLNSNLFWWYYSFNFDMYNLKDYMIFGFRFDYPDGDKKLSSLGQQLVDHIEASAKTSIVRSRTRGEVETKLYVVSKSKHIIDEIDTVLAEHYNFTPEELDYIINYDIKYRMGEELQSDE